jgi:dihydrofolate reductase
MMLALIAAMDRNRVIGKDNRLPWRLPADMRRFRALTMGKRVLMGRKTFESIGRPLEGRINLVLTRDPGFSAPGCEVLHSADEALDLARSGADLMVIGGASVYQQFMAPAERLYLTLVHHELDGDAWFPPFTDADWGLAAREDLPADAEHPFPYSFLELHRQW